tara:strand:- start:1056 stop:1331 length:276 start_codon:yes stop_codon:yes gene_type:complete
MNDQANKTKEELILALIDQELVTIDWDHFPEIPIDATYAEALNMAKEKLEREYSLISYEDILSLYSIFIDESISKDGLSFVELDEIKAKAS